MSVNKTGGLRQSYRDARLHLRQPHARDEKSPQAGFSKSNFWILIIYGPGLRLWLLLTKINNGLRHLVSRFNGFRVCLEVALGNN